MSEAGRGGPFVDPLMETYDAGAAQDQKNVVRIFGTATKLWPPEESMAHSEFRDPSSEFEEDAVVLLSGGLDSTTVLAMALAQGFRPHALTFRYGQRHAAEIRAAARVAAELGVARHMVAGIDLAAFGGSALTGDDLEVPRDRPTEQMESQVPVTYVPARNTIFLSFALAWAEVLRCTHIFIGVNALDYSGYPDCRPAFIEAFEQLAAVATRMGTEDGARVRVHAPLMHLNKAEIIREGLKLGVDYGLTHTCYDPAPGGESCGRCDACRLRLKGFAEAGVADPLPYAARG